MKIHQLLAGRDFAKSASSGVELMAAQMQNYVYLIEVADKQCAVVDPAWDVAGILACAQERGLQPVGALFTHRHLDHTGGRVALQGRKVEVPGLLHFVQNKLPVYVGEADVEATARQTGASKDSIRAAKEGDVLFGCVTVVHTPGHTPGSVCFRIGDECLVSGDTLFIGSCGRVDLAESDPDMMEASLARLAAFPPAMVVYPGHNYAAPSSSTIATERRSNSMMRQAVGASALQTNPTSASAALPDYVSAARRALAEEQELGLLGRRRREA
jgi:glyoxylase-like metal-dependent hydrolase (beta-lactamase superfamily II)